MIGTGLRVWGSVIPTDRSRGPPRSTYTLDSRGAISFLAPGIDGSTQYNTSFYEDLKLPDGRHTMTVRYVGGSQFTLDWFEVFRVIPEPEDTAGAGGTTQTQTRTTTRTAIETRSQNVDPPVTQTATVTRDGATGGSTAIIVTTEQVSGLPSGSRTIEGTRPGDTGTGTSSKGTPGDSLTAGMLPPTSDPSGVVSIHPNFKIR